MGSSMMNCLSIIVLFRFYVVHASVPYPRNIDDFSSNTSSVMVPVIFPSAKPSSGNATIYSYTTWSAYSQCDKRCGGGMSQRYRKCISNTGQEVALTMCSPRSSSAVNSFEVLQLFLAGKNLASEVQKVTCNQQPCSVTEWQAWSACSFPCGGGIQSSSRKCLDGADETCNFQSRRNRRCNEQPCFVMSQWQAWGKCSKICGGGFRRRDRVCLPFLSRSDPQYTGLEALIQHFSSYSLFEYNIAPYITESEVLFHYLVEYRNGCVNKPTQQNNRCNIVPCPKCEKNQIYHECKPCVERCKPSNSVSSIFDIKEDVKERIVDSLQGCNNQCVPGCGCPILSPYLGSDGNCYSFQAQCPSGILSRIFSFQGQPGFAKTFVSTTRPVVAHSTQHYPQSTTKSTTKTPAITTTTTLSTTTEIQCQYDIYIATTPGVELPCECVGYLESTPCYATAATSCPVICRRENIANRG